MRGVVCIWVLNQTEDVTKERMRQLGYQYRDKIIWEKVTSKGNPVNGNGWVVRHSIETLLIFSKGKCTSIMNYHNAKQWI